MAAPPRPPRLKQPPNESVGMSLEDEIPYGMYAKPHKSHNEPHKLVTFHVPEQIDNRRAQDDKDSTHVKFPFDNESSFISVPERRPAVMMHADVHIYDTPRRWSDSSSGRSKRSVKTSIPGTATDKRPGSLNSECAYDTAIASDDLRSDLPPAPHTPAMDKRPGSLKSECEYDTAMAWGDLPCDLPRAPGPPDGDVRLRRIGAQKSAVTNRPPKPLTMTHSSKIEGDQIKIILELKSPETDVQFSRVPLRLVCLFDISGSMGQQIGAKTKGRRDTKIVKMRNLAKILTNTLDETDYLGVLGFGHDTEILSPLTKNEPGAKKEVLSKVRELGRNGLSLTTNLSRGLLDAIDMFRQDSKRRGWKHFDTRDVIVVLTDGDINDGITDGQSLVREVRQVIRELEIEGEYYNKEPSLTISTVTTGNNVAEAVYLLSKTCGSDAFYYIDKDTDTLEIGALMPVLMRMTSVASSISIQAEALDPAEMLPMLCSHEYMAHLPHERDDEIWYFLHDLGLGISKHLLIALDKESVMCETDQDAAVLRVKVEYRDAMMEKRFLTHEVRRSEFKSNPIQQSLALSIQDIRRISQLALRDVAKSVKVENNKSAVAGLLQSIVEVNEHVQQHTGELSRPSEKKALTGFVEAVTANLTNLMDLVEDSQKTTGNKWSAVKSVASAIAREAPSAPKLLGENTRYRKKESASKEETEMRRVIQDEYKKRGVKSAIFYDFDITMEELSDSLQRGEKPPYFPQDDPEEAMTTNSCDCTASRVDSCPEIEYFYSSLLK